MKITISYLLKYSLSFIFLKLLMHGCSTENDAINKWKNEDRQELNELVSTMVGDKKFSGKGDDLFNSLVALEKLSNINSDTNFLYYLRSHGYDSVAIYTDGSALISSFHYTGKTRFFDGFLYSRGNVIGYKKNGFTVVSKMDENWYYVQYLD